MELKFVSESPVQDFFKKKTPLQLFGYSLYAVLK